MAWVVLLDSAWLQVATQQYVSVLACCVHMAGGSQISTVIIAVAHQGVLWEAALSAPLPAECHVQPQMRRRCLCPRPAICRYQPATCSSQIIMPLCADALEAAFERSRALEEQVGDCTRLQLLADMHNVVQQCRTVQLTVP